MPEFTQHDLTGPEWFELDDVVFREVGFNRVVMRGVDVADLEIDGEIGRLVVNGVEVRDHVEAELDRRYPDRAAMRPTDPEGFRRAWDRVERFWAVLVDEARELPPESLHASVDGEWSFVDTLRHLVFATDAWVRRAIQGDPAPWDPLGLPWSGMPATPGVPDDRTAKPPLDTVLALRRDRMATVRDVVDALTPESLAEDTEPVEGPGWPPPASRPVARCLRVVLGEEFQHHLFAKRDLDILRARQA